MQFERRPTDDLKHVSGRGLLLERFAQLVEQPRVLDGDDGLIGEISASSICFCVNAVGVVRSRFTTPKTWPSA